MRQDALSANVNEKPFGSRATGRRAADGEGSGGKAIGLDVGEQGGESESLRFFDLPADGSGEIEAGGEGMVVIKFRISVDRGCQDRMESR